MAKDVVEAEIEWKMVGYFSNTSELKELVKHIDEKTAKSRGFYALCSYGQEYHRKFSHYIGQTYNQNLETRPAQDHGKAYKKLDDFLKKYTGMMGYLLVGVVSFKSLERDTQKLFDDIEACLIYDNQHDNDYNCNSDWADEYDRARDAVVTNKGEYSPLKEKSDSREF